MAVKKGAVTKEQIAARFANKFGIARKTATSIIDGYAALAISETKKKGGVYPSRDRQIGDG